MTASPSASPITPAAVWMDRLSDRLGSLIPGGSQWPPRHPMKVSLVMALLGVMAGWLAVGLHVVIHELRRYSWNPAVTTPGTWIVDLLPSFCVSWALLLLPLAIWADRRRWLACFGLPITALSHAAAFSVWMTPLILIDTFLVALVQFAIAILPILVAHALWAGLVVGRRMMLVLIASVPGGEMCGLLCACLFDAVSSSVQDDTLQIIMMAMPPTTFYAVLGIALGISLWDFTARQKFAPDEPS